MRIDPRGPAAARLRQRKFRRLADLVVPPDGLPGSLALTHRRCGKPTCHCASGEGHPVWSLTFMVAGKKRVERIPDAWVADVRRRVEAGRAFKRSGGGGVRGQCATAGLVATAGGAAAPPMIRRLRAFATRHAGLGPYLEAPGDGRMAPVVPASALLWAVLVAYVVRDGAVHAVEALVRSPARPVLGIRRPFSDDTVASFTERPDVGVTRRPRHAGAPGQAAEGV